jgi:uncharacterized protein (DUF1800 family)
VSAAVRDGADAGSVAFAFQERLHEPGVRTLLGTKYDQPGEAQGRRAIADLCRHPSTARFVAAKLAAHFVDDDPPSSAVDTLADVFRRTGGDLRAVADALIELPEAWSDNGRKFRTPQDWIVGVLRAFGVTDLDERVLPLLRQLRHPLWSPPAPKGLGDSVQEWADPDSLLNRAEVARTIVRRLGASRPDPRLLLDVVDIPAGDPLRDVLADTSITAADRVSLAIAGPAFQWR